MSFAVFIEISCDMPNCHCALFSLHSTVVDAHKEALDCGWNQNEKRKDLCPNHP
jgi:hypothetical protein